MGQVDDAEQFLRDGLRANPNSYEILYELGRVCDEDRHDPIRARNLWVAALRQWQKQQGDKPDADRFLFVEIISHLATIEKRQGDYEPALAHMGLWKKYSPNPREVEKGIEELRQECRSAPGSGAATNSSPTRSGKTETHNRPEEAPQPSGNAGLPHVAAPETGALR